MATLGQAFAALVMRLSDRLGMQSSDVLAFPSFQTRLSLEQVEHVSNPEKVDTTDGAAARRRALSIEAFSRLVNHISTGKRDFVLSGQPLWDIYQQVLQNAETAEKPEAEATRAMVEFRNRKDAMMLNERRSVSGISEAYWPVGVNPIVDLRDAQSWTRIALDQKAIEGIANKVPKDLEEWLQARDLMRSLNTIKVSSVSIEACHLSIRRNWFDQNVLSATNWRLRDTGVLSDGGNPPAGLLPALVQGVVLTRKLEVEVESVPDVKMMTLAMQPNNPAKLASAPLLLQTAFVMSAPRTLDSFAQKPKRGDAALDKTEAETATAGFPSPVIVKAQRIIEQLDKNIAAASLELEKAGQQLAAQRSELANSERQISAIERSMRQPSGGVGVVSSRPRANKAVRGVKALKGRKGSIVREHRTVKSSTSVDVRALRAKLAQHTERVNVLKSEITKTEANQRSLNEQLNKLRDEKQSYEKLATDPFGADEVFLFAVVCRKTPKSPNPSPKFFST